MGKLEDSEKVTYVKSNKVSETIGEAFFALPMAGLFIASLGVLAYQIYLWLYAGFWKSLSAAIVLEKILPDSFFVWLQDKNSWVGAKKIITGLTNMSLALFLFICGVIWIFLAIEVLELIDKKKRQSKVDYK
jgi:hypothetical protein